MASRIFGEILCDIDDDEKQGLQKHESQNLSQLEKLPPIDIDPPLTREMFSVSSFEGFESGAQNKHAISFLGTHSIASEEWDIWLDKFESLLKIIIWSKAKLSLEFDLVPEGQQERKFTYRWQKVKNGKPDSWAFAGGPRVFGDGFQDLYNEANFIKSALRMDSANLELMQRHIRILTRIRRFDEAAECFAKLKAVNHDAAMMIEPDLFKSWADKVGLNDAQDVPKQLEQKLLIV